MEWRRAAGAGTNGTSWLVGAVTGCDAGMADDVEAEGYVAWRATPVNNAPATILPMVTGRRFQSRNWPTEMGAPKIIPEGMRNMFTTECSNPSAKKVMMGSHIAAIFPTVEREASANTAPMVTIQLQRMPFTTAVAQPLGPSAT